MNNIIQEYLTLIQENETPPQISEKVKKLTVNILPPDLKNIAVNWPVIIKNKLNYDYTAYFYEPNFINGKPLTSKHFEKIKNDAFLSSIDVYINHAYHYDPGNEYFKKRAGFNVNLVNEKLMFCFIMVNFHSLNGWCYSPVDKLVYRYNGHDESDGFGINEKEIIKVPYKKWIQLWNKFSTYKVLIDKRSDRYENKPDVAMTDCLNNNLTLSKYCKPFNYNNKSTKYCLNILKKLPRKIQLLFNVLIKHSDVLILHLKNKDDKMKISRNDEISFDPLNKCSEVYKNPENLSSFKKGLFPFGDVNDYTILIDFKNEPYPILLLKRNKLNVWFKSYDEFFKELTYISPLGKKLEDLIKRNE